MREYFSPGFALSPPGAPRARNPRSIPRILLNSGAGRELAWKVLEWIAYILCVLWLHFAWLDTVSINEDLFAV